MQPENTNVSEEEIIKDQQEILGILEEENQALAELHERMQSALAEVKKNSN
jgi:hypothetical protein